MNRVVIYLLIIFTLTSCSDIEDYSYGKGKFCLRYKLSEKKEVRTTHFSALNIIDCRIKADVKYVRLDQASDSPYCRLEACPEILDRISVTTDASGRLILDYSKCVQDHRLPVVSVTIGGHSLEEVYFLGRRFYSTDTIFSNSGSLTLKLKYRRSHFDVTCNVPLLHLENSLYGENFIVSGYSDSVYSKLHSNNFTSGIDLRSLAYRSLHIDYHNNDEDSFYNVQCYAGEPDYIYFGRCFPLVYRGTPQIIRTERGDSCEVIRPE
jgi:hypothetical protein